MRHVLVINGNPDPAPERLCGALARTYAEGAEETGCLVHRINIGALEFPLLRRGADFLEPPSDPQIVSARSQIQLARHIVFIFPLWLGGPPALLKAFMEQVARGGFALVTEGRGFPKGALKGRSARVIVTMGMPAPVYRLLFGAHGVKAFNRGILNMSGIRPVRTTYFGTVDAPSARIAAMIETVRQLGRKMR